MRNEIKNLMEKRTAEILFLTLLVSLIVAGTQASNILDAGSDTDRVAEYRFEEGGGETVYDINGTNDGTINGAEWTTGVRGNALGFSSDGDQVTVSDDSSLEGQTQGITVSFWFYSRQDNVGDWSEALAKGEFANDPYAMIIDNIQSDTFRFNPTLGDQSGDYYRANIDNIPHRTWTHLVMRYDPDTGDMTVFRDGKLKDTTSVGDIDLATNSKNLQFGEGGAGGYIDGKIDETRIYNKPLNNSQIKSLNNQGSYRIGKEENQQNASKVYEMDFQNQNTSHVYDTSRYSNHGKPENDASQENAWNCQVGRCYSFDGDNDYINAGSDSTVDLSQKGEYTISAWARLDSRDGKDQDIVSKGGGSGSIQLRYDNGEDSWFLNVNDGSWKYAKYTTVKTGEWTHVAGTYNGTHIELYVNGEKGSVTDTVDTTVDVSGEDLEIGRRGGSSNDRYFNGNIDQVKIYNTSMNKEDIWSLYSQGRDKQESNQMAGPMAHYPMQVEASPLRDITGEGNTGDINLLGESGTFNTSNGEWKTIRFNRSYENPVVVGTTNTKVGESAIYFETRNVQSHKAEMRLCESEGADNDGCDTHGTERAGYIVIDAASTDNIPGIEAGTFELGGHSFNTETYTESFTDVPMVFSQVMTDNGDGEVVSWTTSNTVNDFQVNICQQNSENGCDSSHPTEEIGWIAIEPGNEPFEQLGETNNLSNEIGNSNWGSVTFDNTFSEKPVGIFSVQNNDGSQDPKVDEIRNVETDGMEMRFCEADDQPDECDGHIDMEYAYLAVGEGLLTYTSGNYPRYVDTERGKALEFDGSDDSVPTGSRIDIGSTGSISAWVKKPSTSGTKMVVDKYSGSYGYSIFWSGDDLHANYGSCDFNGLTDPELNEWNHITLVNDDRSNECKLFLNGEKIASAASGGNSDVSDNVHIGSRGGSGNYFDGQIDDIRIYPYALTKDQVRQVMNKGSVSFG